VGQLGELGGGEREDITVVAETGTYGVLEVDLPLPVAVSDDGEIDIAVDRRFAAGDRAEQQHSLYVGIHGQLDDFLERSYGVD
jgi:hypothetical protein